jgi:hypothetical protein
MKNAILVQSQLDVQNFKGGRLSHFIPFWKEMKANKMIMNIVGEGLKIEFETLPVQNAVPRVYKFDQTKMQKK